MLFRDLYQTPTHPRTTMSWATVSDLPAIRRINASVLHPWTPAEMLHRLGDPRATTMVAARGDTVVAFMNYDFSPKEIALAHFAVDPGQRHIGIGSQMWRTLVEKLSPRGRPRLTAALPEDDMETVGWFVGPRRGMRGVRLVRDGVRPGLDRYLLEFWATDAAGIGAQNCPGGHDDVP